MVSIHHRESNENDSSDIMTKSINRHATGVFGHGRQHTLFTNCDKVVVLKLEHYELVSFVLCFILM